jgi:IS30 family transposase
MSIEEAKVRLDLRRSTPRAIADSRRCGIGRVDTMLGAGQAGPCVLSMVERKPGYVLVGRLCRRTTAEVNRRAARLSGANATPCLPSPPTTAPSFTPTLPSSDRPAPG